MWPVCRDGTTTYSEGATSCDLSVSDGGSVIDSQSASDYAILLSFGVVLDGTTLEAVTRSTTGINGSSKGIVAVLVRGDTASALNVSLGSVKVLAVQQISSRQLLVNVSATVPVPIDDGAAAATQDLSAGAGVLCVACAAGFAVACCWMTLFLRYACRFSVQVCVRVCICCCLRESWEVVCVCLLCSEDAVPFSFLVVDGCLGALT